MELHKQIISILSESPSKFVATDISLDPDMIMCLVMGDSEGADDYYGVNVLFVEGGKVEMSTADKVADEQAAKHKDEIIKVAKAEVMKEPMAKEFMQQLGHK
jgi:hypothetical protein